MPLMRNDAHCLAVVGDQQMAIAAVFHQPKCFDRHIAENTG